MMDALAINAWSLPYVEQLAAREVAAITLVVVHCTELPDLATAREFGERILYADTGTGNSGHFYIDRDGGVHEFVPVTRVANHTRGFNLQSVGIELVNRGRYPHWLDSRHQQMTEPYSVDQIASLRALLARLKFDLPSLVDVAAHEDLDTTAVNASDDATKQVFRKRDPGVMFPWPDVLSGSDLSRRGRATE